MPASGAHVGPIATRMRAEDRLECEAHGHTPKQALRAGLMTSADVWTAKVDGSAHAMFGLVVRSAIGGLGTPWFLGTNEVWRHPRLMMRAGLVIVDRWTDSTPTLENLVSAANHRAIRLLRYWGFDIGSELQMIGGHPFLTFRLDRSIV